MTIANAFSPGGKGQEVVRDFEVVENDRGVFESHWKEVAELILPAYRDFFESSGSHQTAGQKRTDIQYDSTGAIGLSRFAAVVDSLLTPANKKWSRYVASNKDLMKDRDVRLYFETVTDLVHHYRYQPKSNFQSQNFESFRQLGAFGTGPMFVEKRRDQPGLRYKSLPISEVFLRENAMGIVDTFYRRYNLTARQIIQEWPDAGSKIPKLNDEAKNAQKNSKRYQIIHCVRPRRDYDPNRSDARGKKFESVYVFREQGVVLSEGGYRSFPLPMSRYYTVPTEVYGRSPAMDVLPALKTLNEQKRTVLKAGHKAVDPTLLVYDDGVLEASSLLPGHAVVGGMNKDGRPLVGTIPTGNPAAGRELMELEIVTVNDAFLVTLFQIMTENPQMTATEVVERVKEKGILLNPTVGRQQAEYLSPLGEREIDVLDMQNLLPPPPPALLEAEGEYEIEFDSPMSKAARAEEAAGVMRAIEQTLTIVGQTGDPAPLDNFDFDIIVSEWAEIGGSPLRYMRSPEVIAALREQRAQAAQQQQAIEAAPAAAGLAKVMQGN